MSNLNIRMASKKTPSRKGQSRNKKKNYLGRSKVSKNKIVIGLLFFVGISIAIVVYALAGGPQKPDDIATPRCYGNGSDGPRVQVVYLYSSTPRASSDGVGDYAKSVDRWLKQESFNKQSQTNINFVTDARSVGCDVLVAKIPVNDKLSPREQIIEFYGTSRIDRRYMVFTDSSRVSGGDTLSSDPSYNGSCVAATEGIAAGGNGEISSPTPANPYNVGGSFVSTVSLACNKNPVLTATHEFLHSLGAVISDPKVNYSAVNYWSRGEFLPDYFGLPSNYYNAGHVNTLNDIMYPIDAGQPVSLDPGCDDYFCPTNSPNIGEKLSNHWNVWKSDFLYRRGRTYPSAEFVGSSVAKEYNVDQVVSYVGKGTGGTGEASVVAASVTIDGISVKNSLVQQSAGSELKIAGEINLANFTSNNLNKWFGNTEHEITLRFRNQLGNLSTVSKKFIIKSRQEADSQTNPLVSKQNIPESGRLPTGNFKGQTSTANISSYCYLTIVCGNAYVLTHTPSGEKWNTLGHWRTISEDASIPPPVNDLIIQNTAVSNGAKLFTGKSSNLANIIGMNGKKLQACWYVRPFNKIPGNDIDVTMKIDVGGVIRNTSKTVSGGSYQELCVESDTFSKDTIVTGNNPFELTYDNPKGSTLKVWSFRVLRK